MKFRDVELLSAYLDGQLSQSDSAKLESRLAADPDLNAVMGDLRTARGLLRQLPQRRAPRNFMLSPKMAGLKAPEPRAYPAFRLATVLAALMFIITFAVNGFAPFTATHLSAAQAPAYGLGGGGGGGGCENCGASEAAPAPTTVPALPFSAIAPTEARPSVQDNTQNLGTPTPQFVPKAAAPSLPANNPPVENSPESPIPPVWQISIGIITLICGATAWFLRLRNEQEFHKQWNKK
jgi:hypothetical protein